MPQLKLDPLCVIGSVLTAEFQHRISNEGEKKKSRSAEPTHKAASTKKVIGQRKDGNCNHHHVENRRAAISSLPGIHSVPSEDQCHAQQCERYVHLCKWLTRGENLANNAVTESDHSKRYQDDASGVEHLIGSHLSRSMVLFVTSRV